MDSSSPASGRAIRRWLPFLAWTAFVACVITWAETGTMPHAFRWIGRQPWGDKLAHFLLIGTVAFLLDYALAGRRVSLRTVRVRLALLIVTVVMTVEELSQLWIPGRDFEWGDLLANYAGIAAAALLLWWLDRRRLSAPPAEARPSDRPSRTAPVAPRNTSSSAPV